MNQLRPLQPNEVSIEQIRQIAAAIVHRAIGDLYMDAGYARKAEKTKTWARTELRRIEDDKRSAYEFLTGQTTISRYWMDIIGMKPLEGSFEEICDLLKDYNLKRGTA